MPKNTNSRPTNANYQDLLVDFEGWDFSQFGAPQVQPQEEDPGFWGKAWNSGAAIAEGITMFPGGVADTVRDVRRAGDIDVNDAEAMRARQEREREQAEYARKYQGKTFEGVTDAMLSMPYSLTTMGASLGGGAAGALAAGPVGAGAAGMAAAGTVAYRATKQQFLEQMLDQTAKVLSRMPTQDEWDRIATEFDGEATEYGLWEAGPEALSNLFMTKLLGPLGKNVFKGGLGSVAKRIGGLYGEEFATETATEMGQGAVESEVGLRESAPGAWEALKRVAPATFWQTTLMAGGKKAADFAANRMRRRAEDTSANASGEAPPDDTQPPSGGGNQLALPPGGQLALPEAPIRMGTDQTGHGPIPINGRPGDAPGEFLSEADMAEIDAFVRDYETHEQAQGDAAMLIEDGRPAGRSITQLALNQGDTVDLLALPGIAQGIGGFALPPGTGALPMGTRSTGQGPIAPPTDFAGVPLATPFMPRPALPQQSGPSSGQGRWAGGRSQLAYGGGMMQGLGFMDVQTEPQSVPIQAMPTANQITNTQPAPRADTMAQAEALGMLAPNPLPQQDVAMPSQVFPSASPVQKSVRTRQVNFSGKNEQSRHSLVREGDLFNGFGNKFQIEVGPREGFINTAVAPKYNKTPSNEAYARAAAARSAEKLKKPLFVYAGNSYGNFVWRIAEPEKTNRVEMNDMALNGWIVTPDGMYFSAKVAKENQERNTASAPSAGVVQSDIGGKETKEATHAAGRGTLAGNGGEVRQAALPARGSEEGITDSLQDGSGLVRQGGKASSSQGNFESLRRERSAGTVRKERAGSRSRPEKADRRGTSIKIPNRDAEPANYELMEADDVRASHLPDHSFQKNPKYGLENERRYHDEPASQRKVLENAAHLDPDFVLKESVDANNGAPVVDHEGNVLGGNGRAMSIRKAYLTDGERAKAYRAALRDRAGELGLDSADVDAMRHPILVRRLEKAHSRAERQALVTAMNDSFTDSKNSRASGKTRGDRLSGRSLEMLAEGLKEADTLRQYFDEPESAAAVEQLIRDGVIQGTERNAYVGVDGLLNPDGKRVVEEALRGRIARNYDALAKLSSDVVGKMDAVIPSVLIAEEIGGPWSVTEPLRDAVDLLAEFRASGTRERGVFLGQVNMLTGKTPRERYSPSALQLFTLALESKKADFSQRFRRYASEAQRSPETNGLPGIALSQPEAAEQFLGMTRQAQTADTKETVHVNLDSDRSVERDSQGSASQNGMGEESLSVDGKRDGGIGGEGGRQTGENVSSSRGEGLPGHAAPAAGARRDSGVGEETSGIRERSAGSEHGGRGRGDGQHGLDVRGDGEETVGKPVERGSGERVKTLDAHLREVRETLPDLYPGQQEDVVLAEKRFRAGQGMMFTNGTGTGKTGLGLGVISRLVRAGRREILIAVPADKIASDWIALGKKLGVPVSKLADTKDAGMGVTVTTHANMAQNDSLFNRQWDLIVIDEAHKLSSSQQGTATNILQRVRGLSLHPRGLFTRAEKTGSGPELTKEIATLQEKELNGKGKERLDTLLANFRKWQDEVQSEIEAAKGPNCADLSRSDGKKPGVLLLSATPFAYEKSVDYAEGFLFDYPEVESKGGYNQPNSYDAFMIEHFGYRMRYGKLTRPEAEVDASLMQRQFNSWLKKQGVLGSRNLDTPFDYDRRFILTENAIGQKIDDGLDFLRENYERYGELHTYIDKRFDYLAKRYLLEAIKAKESIGIIQKHIELGRKVVVFHQFNKGGGFNPFDVSTIGPHENELYAQARAFAAERPDLVRLPLKNLPSPVATLKRAFPDALIFSGLVSKKDREEAVKEFQADEGGTDIVIVQADAGEAGLSLHDTTGKHQRVLLNIGLPTKPVTAIQQEGRIFRAGQQSNAMFRYLNTGTNWERYAFAQTIAQRASAAENLAMGEEARGLREAFIQAFEDSDIADVGAEGEGTGGKARDRALQTVISEFDAAKTFYFGQQKKNVRTKTQEGVDYFATPEPLGQKMVEWAAIEPGTDVLEPSAGHGAIARWFPESANRTVVEPSAALSSRLMLVTDAKLRNHLFEKLDIVNKYDSIVMNPPFGKGGKTAMEHIEKAFRHLRRNGRIVAIVPDGPSMQKRLDAFFDYDEKSSLVPMLRREITLPDVAFERAGTKVNGKVLIIDAADRQALHDNGVESSSRIELDNAKTIGEVFDRIENMGAPARLARDFSRTEHSPAASRAEVAEAESMEESVSVFGKAETTHEKKHIPLFVAKRERSLSDEEYRTVSAIAKKHGGYWSGYNKNGAIPGWQFEGMEDRDSFISEADDALLNQESMTSLAPGEFLPPRRKTRLHLRIAAVQSLADVLGRRAKNAAPVRVVQHFEELPASIRNKHAENATSVEGVYDPRSRMVWLVADNLTDAGRAAEVWAHEQFVHHGLRGLFTDAERKRLLVQLWTSLGGMQNQAVREVAELYGLDPRSNLKARLTVMEEVVASMAEKRAMDSMTPQELNLWKRIVNAVLRAWNNLVSAVSGRSGSMGFENVDHLLSYLGGYVMDGRTSPGFGFGGNMGFFSAEGVFPSLRTSPAPKDTIKAYKLFRVRKDRPGKLFPLFVGADEAIDTGIWLDAEIGPDAGNGKVKSKLGALAMRPGWHAGDAPVATHIGDKANAGDKAPSFRPENQVWAEVELANDIDWQIEANQRAQRNKTGNIIPRTAHITDRIPTDGFYRYKTNPNMTGNWIIAGSMKVNRILSDAEVERINKENGIADLPRRQPFDVEKYGFSEMDDDAPLASLSPRDILGMTVRRAAKSANAPEIRHMFKKDDIGLLQGIAELPHWIAKKHPDFAKVYERQLQRMDERAAALKKSLETVPSMFGGERLKAADMQSLRTLLWEQEGKEPKQLEGIEKFLVEDTLVTGREIIKPNPEFYISYKAWLDDMNGTKAAKSAMLEIRKSLDQDLVLAHNRMAAMSEVSDDTIKEFRQSIGHVPNYFPHHRYGAYFVQAKVGKEVVFRQHFDAMGERAAMAKARKIVEEQRKKYPDAEWADGKNDRLPDEVLGAPIDSEAMEQIIRAATSKIGDKERAREINELLAEGVSDVLKTRGWGSHAIQRKGTPGFETEDIAKVLYDYKAGLNGWLTKMEAARDFSTALSKINARQAPGLWKYTSQYVRDMLRNSDRIDRVTGNIKAVAFAWYLGGSIKTAFVNATQNLVVGVPRLQMDVMGGGREWLAGARDALVDRVTGSKGKGLTDEETRLIHELYGESVITDVFMEEVRGQLRGVSGATMWNKFTKTMGWPMSEVERFNRASLALAAFRAARGGKLKVRAREKYNVKGKVSYEQAKAFATDVVRDAHFVYGKSNMPEFMRSNAAGRSVASMYTFRTFSHNMIDMWTWALKSQGREGAAFVAKSLGATMALGGVTALPLYATLMALFQAATGDDDDWTEKIRSWLPQNNLLRDAVCYGAPAMAGVNIGGSLKMETPLTKGLTAGRTPQEVLADSIGDIIGIPYDLLVVKPSRMLDAHGKGNTWRVLEEAAPVALKNAMQAWRLYSEGQTTMTGRAINDPGKRGARKLSEAEAVGKFLGFQPVSSTKSYDAYAAGKHASQVRSDKIDEMTVLALQTYDTGDQGGRREMIRELREWNERMKAEGKPHMLINFKDVMRRVKSRRRENRVNAKTRQQQVRQQEVWG